MLLAGRVSISFGGVAVFVGSVNVSVLVSVAVGKVTVSVMLAVGSVKATSGGKMGSVFSQPLNTLQGLESRSSAHTC